MKNLFLSAVVAGATLASCSAVSSILQNTFPYNSTILVAANAPANTTLSNVSAAQSINQLAGTGANVHDITATSATLSVSNNSSSGIFKSVKLYLSNNGSSEILVASREDIPDNVGISLALDLNPSETFDEIMKSGNVQARIVYVLKQSPTVDITVKTSVSFTSVPNTKD